MLIDRRLQMRNVYDQYMTGQERLAESEYQQWLDDHLEAERERLEEMNYGIEEQEKMASLSLEREDHMRNTERKHLPPEYLERLGTVTELICVCGHVGERHEMEPPYPCYECSCESYTVTAIPPPEDAFDSQAPYQLDPADFDDDAIPSGFHRLPDPPRELLDKWDGVEHASGERYTGWDSYEPVYQCDSCGEQYLSDSSEWERMRTHKCGAHLFEQADELIEATPIGGEIHFDAIVEDTEQ
jgi:hypothetical protein